MRSSLMDGRPYGPGALGNHWFLEMHAKGQARLTRSSCHHKSQSGDDKSRDLPMTDNIYGMVRQAMLVVKDWETCPFLEPGCVSFAQAQQSGF